MRFRPKFCSNCGEKIERVEWKIWTSRRFCDLCATEFRLTELGPIAGAGIAVLALAGMIANSFSADPVRASNNVRTVSHARAFAATPAAATPAATVPPISKAAAAEAAKPAIAEKQTEVAAVTYCGAETKKGTPCSRRVKGGGRCYQHAGMPAMTKLRN